MASSQADSLASTPHDEAPPPTTSAVAPFPKNSPSSDILRAGMSTSVPRIPTPANAVAFSVVDKAKAAAESTTSSRTFPLATSSTISKPIAPSASLTPPKPVDDDKEEGEIDEDPPVPEPPSEARSRGGEGRDEGLCDDEQTGGNEIESSSRNQPTDPSTSSSTAIAIPDNASATASGDISFSNSSNAATGTRSVIEHDQLKKAVELETQQEKRKPTSTPTWDTEPTPRTPLNARTTPLAPINVVAAHSATPNTREGDVDMDDDIILTPSKTLSPLRKLVNVDNPQVSPLSPNAPLPSGSALVNDEKEPTPTPTHMEVDSHPPKEEEEIPGRVKVTDDIIDGGDGEGVVPVASGVVEDQTAEDRPNLLVASSENIHTLPTDVPMDTPSADAGIDDGPTSSVDGPPSGPLDADIRPNVEIEIHPSSTDEVSGLANASSPKLVQPPSPPTAPESTNPPPHSPNAYDDTANNTHPPPGSTNDGAPILDRPLNVSDALSYLDAVKVQFVDKPNVYNRFLDIMKEFKGQMIDTPGVIRRVTQLFDGHPSLIQGFNTFLPAGYRIECTFPTNYPPTGDQEDYPGACGPYPPEGVYNEDEQSLGMGYLTVTTPNGVTRHRMGNLGSMKLVAGGESSSSGFGLREGEPQGVLFGPGIGNGMAGLGASNLPSAPGYDPSLSSSIDVGGPGVGLGIGGVSGGSGIQSEAIEPAVQYVQKIKQRCDAETYRQFLDILGRYHASPGVMDEREVSLQIAQLFKDAPDLRSDFRIFMPPKTQQLLDDEALYGVSGGDILGSDRDIKGKRKPVEPAPSFGSLPLKKRRRAGERERDKERDVQRERERERENIVVSKSNSLNRGKHASSYYDVPGSSKFPAGRMSPPPIARRSHHIQANNLHSHTQQHPLSSIRNSGLGSFPNASYPNAYTHSQPITSPTFNDPGQFFARVKQSLDTRETYNEFLKIINLFTQGYIDTARLIKEASTFLGEGGEGGELLRTLKGIVGWDERKEREMWMEDVSVNVVGVGMTGGGKGSGSVEWARPVVVERRASAQNGDKVIPGRVDLSVQYGSYRKLPASEVNSLCSGRDEMCRSVLNDEWVSHPTYASEDSGSPIFKKNVYEEALHRSEEERHEYDFHIDAISKMIALLEPINNKVVSLVLEERHNFKLKPNLGGAAKSIHFRVVKKIYGRDTGLEVIQAMQDSPGLAIPIVFARLKQKEEEWKRAQREWNKVWREVDARNYQKSLDYQSTNFKANDKKSLSTKALVNQIEGAREEQMAKRASLIDPLFSRTRPRHQMEFVMEDVKVLQEVLKLVFSFLDRMQGQIAHAERKRVELFLRSFVVLFFGLDPVAFNSAFVVVGEGGVNGVPGDGASEVSDEVGSVADDVEIASVTSGTSSRNGGGSNGGRSHRKGGGAGASDLRKKLLKNEQAKSSSSRKTRGGQEGTVTPSGSRLASPVLGDEDGRAGTPPDGSAPGRKLPRKGIFFANTAFYVLLRLLEAFYSRLALFKAATAKLAADPPSARQPNVVAQELGIDVNRDPPLPAAVEHYYDVLLVSCERLFDNEIEQHVFEDQMRAMFGTKIAYKIFTVDKVIGSIIKQVQAIFTDSRSQDLLENLKRDRALASPTTQDLINSRRNAEKVLGPDENLFRIDWLPDSKTVTIQLLGKDDSSFDDSEVLTGRWQAYLDSFVSNEATEGISMTKLRSPFLRRNLRNRPEGAQPAIYAHGGLQIKVCTRTYRLFFVAQSEDVLVRARGKADIVAVLGKLEARSKRRRKWIDSLNL